MPSLDGHATGGNCRECTTRAAQVSPGPVQKIPNTAQLAVPTAGRSVRDRCRDWGRDRPGRPVANVQLGSECPLTPLGGGCA